MAETHITRELIQAVARGEVPPRILVELGLQHLTSLCPTCREEYLAFRREETHPASYATAFESLPTLLKHHAEEVDDRHSKARRDLRELMRLPHQARLTRILRSRTRFQDSDLAEMLLEESKRCMAEDARKAFDFAEAAEAVVRRSPVTPFVGGLRARAAAYMGNASRRLDDYLEAQRLFSLARSIIKTQAVVDTLVYAELDSAEAVLHIDQRRFSKAEDLLSRAIALYAISGAKEKAAHPLLTLGLLHYNQGNCPAAIEATKDALRAIHPLRDRRLYISARFNLALFLCEAGRYREANDAILEDRALFSELLDPYTQLRLMWLKGKVAVGFGQWESAERSLRETREGFILQHHGYDAAMVSLDLARVCLKLGKAAEVQQLAEEVFETFTLEGVQREAVAALLLFGEAAGAKH